MLQHKGYTGDYEICFEDKVIHGRVVGINDVVTYEANTVSELIDEFKNSVEDYLEACKGFGEEPNKPNKTTLAAIEEAASPEELEAYNTFSEMLNDD